MPILTQVNSTKFRSLKYGSDRLNGGSSNQPYIQTPIPDKSPGTGGPDFLLRGGTLLPGRVANDVSRLTQMFVDTRSLNGILFTTKQEILSLTNVDINAGKGPLNSLLSINSKIYNPLTTVAQAAIVAEGGHIAKQGLIPIDIAQSLFGFIAGKDNSRLTNLYNQHIIQPSVGNILYSYGGGPGSTLGIGVTNIKLAIDRTGLNNNNSFSTLSGFLSKYTNFKTLALNDPQVNDSQTIFGSTVGEFRKNDQKYRTGVITQYNTITNNDYSSYFDSTFNVNGQAILSSIIPKPGDTLKITSPSSLTYEQTLNNQQSTDKGSISPDFRVQVSKNNPLYSNSLNYTTKGIDKRINFRSDKPDPKYFVDYAAPVTEKDAYDKLNALEIYRSSTPIKETAEINDLVKFRIAVIDNDDPTSSTYIHFRAYIDSFSDSYGAQWDSIKYVGRGEKFYRYNEFNREISLSWTIAALSKAELAPMYRKLNYLASSLAPHYSKRVDNKNIGGYMSGNLVKLTIGGYLYEQPGIITSLTYDVPSESPWEIGIGTDNTGVTGSLGFNQDPTVKELPHIIKVTDVRFIPIHTFTPQLFNGDYGKQSERFIALSNGGGEEHTLYNNINYKGYTQSPPQPEPKTTTNNPSPAIPLSPNAQPLYQFSK